ncbi:hypothetical protein [Malikia spinosa]|uniref:hypothetical protein n=1 Tax=Malikia spinosa TaxID=86180 RepID=UPI002FD96D65
MAHVRKQIREALATAVTGLSVTGARVYQSRLHALRDSNLPCLLVNTDDETIEPVSMNAPATLERELVVMVRAVARAAADLDDSLDQIMAEVEAVLGAASPLGSLAKITALRSIRVEMDDALEKPLGVASMEYRITYYTASSAPQTVL